MNKFQLGNKFISNFSKPYFIADIGANHDGNLNRAKDLIFMAAESGADCVKFQNFSAHSIVSDVGFKKLGALESHQKKWPDSVFDTYKKASIPIEWCHELLITCEKANVSYLTSPYSFEIVDKVDQYLEAYKIGSGDITWIDFIKHIASKNKLTFLATGASNMGEIQTAVEAFLSINDKLILMQCNTNYTGNLSNIQYCNINVLRTFNKIYPELIIGLSDHTPTHSTVLGAIALGARVIEKHFTDDRTRSGPDHPFAIIPEEWKEMVCLANEVFYSLGDGQKKIENNETESIIVQRRCATAVRSLSANETIDKSMVQFLRPCPPGAISPHDFTSLIGKKLLINLSAGEPLLWDYIETSNSNTR